MSLLKCLPGLVLPRVLVLLMCCRVSADRNYEKKQAAYAAKARDRAMRDALHLVEDLEGTGEAFSDHHARLDATERQQAREASWRQILPKLLAPTSDDGLPGEGYAAGHHGAAPFSRRHRHDDHAQQELLSRLAASVSASGDPQAMRDLDNLMLDMRSLEESDSRQTAQEAVPKPKVEERASSDPLLVAEMESKALKEESLRELESMRHGEGADQASLPEGGGTNSAITSGGEVAEGSIPVSAETGSVRVPRRRPPNRLLEIARERRARARRAAVHARRRALENERPLQGIGDGSSEVSASMATGLTDVTAGHKRKLTGDLAANLRAVEDDAYSASTQDLDNSLDSNGDPLLSDLDLQDGTDFASQMQLNRDDKQCRSTYECQLPSIIATCERDGRKCICTSEYKCEAAASCTDDTGCGADQICVKHTIKGVEIPLCQARLEKERGAYTDQEQKEDVDTFTKEVKNMQDQRSKLQEEAEQAFMKMKDYHFAIDKLTQPMQVLKEQAAKAEEEYAKEIMNHEDDRTKGLVWDPDENKELKFNSDELVDDLDDTFGRLNELNGGGKE